MNKLLPIVFFLICTSAAAQVQDWSWSRSANGSSNEVCTHMCQDGSGNLIVTGRYNSASTAMSTLTLTNSGSNTSDLLIAKYSPTGTLLWAKSASGIGDEEPVSVTSDGSGNIYVAGNYDSPTLLVGTITLSNSSAFQDCFVIKYDPSGNVLWAKSYGGNLLDEARSIIADNSGNTYLTGSFRSVSVTFGTVAVVNSGNSDGYLTKIDPSGNPLWAKQFGAAQNEYGYAVTHDGSGNIYVAGEFNSSNLTTFNLANAGAFDIFIAKYDASGNYLLSKSIGGTLNDAPRYLATDASGNLYMAATYESATLPLGSLNLTNGSSRDMALAKFNSGLTAQWGKRASGNLNSEPTALFVNSSSVFMSGFTTLSTLSFGSVSITNPSTTSEGFMVNYDLSGTDIWAKNTGATGDEEIQGIVVNSVGSIFVAGHYNSTLPLGTSTLNLTGGRDLFLAKICLTPVAPTVASNLSICPRQTATITATNASGILSNWYAVPAGGTPLLTGSNTFTATGTATFYVEAENQTTGCTSHSRSVVTLSVQPGPVVSITGQTLTASAGTVFKWIECKKDSALANNNAQNFVITKSGHYAAIVTNNGCVDTTACIYYSVAPSGTVTVPIDSLLVNLAEASGIVNAFSVYPNPNQGEFFIKSEHITGEVTLHDLLGREVRRIMISEGTTTRVFINDLNNGVYFLRGPEGVKDKRVVLCR